MTCRKNIASTFGSTFAREIRSFGLEGTMTEMFSARLETAAKAVARLRDAIATVVVGQSAVVEQVMWGLVAGGLLMALARSARNA